MQNIKVHVSVEQKDIVTGVPKDGEKCPIACAFERALREAQYPVYEICIEDSHEGFMFRMHGSPSNVDKYISIDENEIVDAFIQNFDNGRPVIPFEFDVELEPKEYDGDY